MNGGTGRPVPRDGTDGSTTTAVLCLVAESWLRDHPAPPEAVRDAFAALAVSVPEVAARMPRLRRLVYSRMSAQVKALDTSGLAGATRQQAEWLSVAEAARRLGLKPDSVRWLLRRGVLDGRRDERGWQVSARKVGEYGRTAGQRCAGAA